MDETDTILAINHKHRIANIPKKANSYSKIIYKWTDEPEQEIAIFMNEIDCFPIVLGTKLVTSAFQSIK